jgi:hypothetical protein
MGLNKQIKDKPIIKNKWRFGVYVYKSYHSTTCYLQTNIIQVNAQYFRSIKLNSSYESNFLETNKEGSYHDIAYDMG